MEYFAHLGYPCPSQCNPADHLIDLVSTDYDSTVTAARDSARIEGLVGAWTRHTATAAAALRRKRPAGAIRGNQIQSEASTLRGKRPAPSAAPSAATTATATAATTATTAAATAATSATATSTAAAAARAAPLPRHPTTPRSRLDLVDLVTRSRRSRHPTTPRSRPPAPSRQTRRCSGRRSPLVRFALLVRRSWCQNVRWPADGTFNK